MDKELRKELHEFNEAAKAVGEEVVFKIFPKKILELHELVSSSSKLAHPNTTDATVYPPPDLDTSEQPQSKKRKLNGGDGLPLANDTQNAQYLSLVVANKHIVDLHQILKTECEELGSSVDKVKLWVTLTMPKIEDGDNFGVQIQEEVLSELHRAQESAYNLRDIARQDHLNRAKICSKLIKYPNVEDYTIALKEHDEKQAYFARQNLIDIRNMYAALTDLIHKNITKIRAPKANNSTGLY